jgi:ABC-type cobalamin/Fe3+-siderophores transport system ATPase subunit
VSQCQSQSRLRAHDLAVGYGDRRIIDGLDLAVPDGLFTVIVGPNACGKSTLLRSLARLLPSSAGTVSLDERPLPSYDSKALARRIGLLPQSPTAPDGLSVADLVARGRYPHQGLFRQWSAADEAAVEAALAAADVAELRDRAVEELSGGQRQRVWLAMALAQETSLLLLDEPTTYLDLSHQLDVLDLARSLVEKGTTVVAVLHELHLAFRYADHLVVMRSGEIVAQGHPDDVVTAELIEQVYDLPCRIITDPVSHTPLVIPETR